jgi:hypothetical protein
MDRPARVLLVGFQDQDNLGLRYLASSLREGRPRIPHRVSGQMRGLSSSRASGSRRHWLSLIFQFMAPAFGDMMRDLRAKSVSAHFTVGGHYASFAPRRCCN